MSAASVTWSMPADRRLAWTPRLVGGAGVVILYALVQLDWLGLVPGTSTNLLAQATWVALAGWWALRVGALGIGLGFLVAVFALFLDQMTLAIAVSPAPTGLPDDYWISNTLRVALALALYPLGARALGSRLPRALAPLALPVVLVALPFLRWFDAPGLVVQAITGGTAGVLVPVPWLPLVAVASVLALGADLVTSRGWFTRPVLVSSLAVVLATLVVPTAQAAAEAYVRTSAVLVTPSAGGPLETVRLETSSNEIRAGSVLWDEGEAHGLGPQPVRSFWRAGIATAFVTPALQPDLAPGAHPVALRIGDTTRIGEYRLAPPGGLDLKFEARVLVVSGGQPRAILRVLIVGAAGPEQFTAELDDAGTWHATRALPAGSFRVVCQSGSHWAELDIPLAPAAKETVR